MSYRGFVDFAQDKRTLRGRQAGRVEEKARYGLKVAHTGAWSDGFSIPRMS
jgi:hypothetical protein